MPKSDAFIENLVRDLPNPSPSRHWGARYVSYWAIWSAAMATGTYALNAVWPDWLRPPTDLFDIGFLSKTAVYVAGTAIFARLAYLHSVPGAAFKRWRGVAGSTAIVLIASVLLLSPVDPRGFAVEYRAELDWAVGPCGFFILFSALAIGTALRIATRRALVTNARAATGWTFAAAASLASVSAELLCRHESPTHMFVWHLVPFAIATLTGISLAKTFEKARVKM